MPALVPLLSVLMLLLAACAGAPRELYIPYGAGPNYGYSEQWQSARTAEVTYRAPVEWTDAYSSAAREREREAQAELAFQQALRRSAELALSRGFAGFTIQQRETDVEVEVTPQPDPFWDPFWSPYGPRRAWGPWGYRPWGWGHPYWPSREARLWASVTLEVHFHEKVPAAGHDAAAVLRRYGEASS